MNGMSSADWADGTPLTECCVTVIRVLKEHASKFPVASSALAADRNPRTAGLIDRGDCVGEGLEMRQEFPDSRTGPSARHVVGRETTSANDFRPDGDEVVLVPLLVGVREYEVERTRKGGHDLVRVAEPGVDVFACEASSSVKIPICRSGRCPSAADSVAATVGIGHEA